MVLHIIRAVFLLAVLALTISLVVNRVTVSGKVPAAVELPSADGNSGDSAPESVKERGVGYYTVLMIAPVVLATAVMLVDLIWRRKNLQALSGLFFGVVSGLAIAYVLGLVVQLVAGIFTDRPDHTITQLIRVLVGATSVYLCVSFIMQTKDDFRFIVPYVEFAKQTRGSRPILLDTSVIIDGRIADVAETGFLADQLVVPRFVLAELQQLADSADKLRRNRGRRGLDILNRLQEDDRIGLRILATQARGVPESAGVDAKLVALGQQLGGRVMTNDYNLNKIAQLRGVDVMNINDLANAMKTVVLPGESLTVKVIKPGEEAGQGVGYLPDGTMVVIEQGRDSVGKDVALTVTSVLQTSAGRMVFGRPAGAGPAGRNRSKRER